MADSEGGQIELLRNCLRQQLDEVELLQSIFSNEFQMSDFSVEADFNEFLKQAAPPPDTQLQFSIRLDLNATTRLDIHIELPQLYPVLEVAKISVLSPSFSNASLTRLRTDLNAFVETLLGDECYIFQAYQWIQDNAESFRSKGPATELTLLSNSTEVPIEMERMWIYSHHLLSKTKRRDMINLGKQLDLTGFHRPGRPGIICVEGRKGNTQEFWRTVRQWNWQKIGVRRSDTDTVVGVEAESQFRRFNLAYHEKVFTNGDDLGGELNEEDQGKDEMSMGLFLKFLEHHNCGDVKRDLFGFE